MVSAFVDKGLSKEEAAQRLWFVDQHGIIVKSRDDLMNHNIPYAHDYEQLSFVDAIKAIKPHILIGQRARREHSLKRSLKPCQR